MKHKVSKYGRIIIAALAATIILLPVAVHAVVTEPYFKVYGADVMSGGWFASGSSCDTSLTGPYQDPLYDKGGSNQSDFNGGILTYENYSRGGASSQYAAYSLGQIQSDQTKNYGFYGNSNNNQSYSTNPSINNSRTFANTYSGGPGYYEGNKSEPSYARQSNCIPDYYAKSTQTTTQPFTPGGCFPSSDGMYQYTNPSSTPVQLFSSSCPVLSPSGTVRKGAKVTIFIKGNVWINSNITNQPGDSALNTTKFALVVLGNIYIDPQVTQLDGWYIAQPDPTNPSPVTNDTGDIWTCHDQSTQAPDMPYVWKNCKSNLLINGSIVAKQFNFLRIPGDVNVANERQLRDAINDRNVAEIINYTPEMVVGGPFFTQRSSKFQLQSLTSLPPVF